MNNSIGSSQNFSFKSFRNFSESRQLWNFIASSIIIEISSSEKPHSFNISLPSSYFLPRDLIQIYSLQSLQCRVALLLLPQALNLHQIFLQSSLLHLTLKIHDSQKANLTNQHELRFSLDKV
jgi:hypothetical protein